MKLNAYFLLLSALVLAFTVPCLRGTPPAIGILYPDIREPYRSVFRNIIEGIQKEQGFSSLKYVLKKDEQLSDVTSWLKKDKIEVAVVLGSRGLEMALEFPDAIQLVYGAVLIPPDSFPRDAKGITLTPDPGILFSSLENLAPEVKRIIVVYNPNNFEWLIALAKLAAQPLGLELKALPVKNLRGAGSQYLDFFAHDFAQGDSIWLLQDPSVIDERTILKLILEEAWKKKIVVFSSNPAYVKRGILFSLYPDNMKMGRSLGGIVRSVIQNEGNTYPPISPLGDLLTAVNLRTAEHLGLRLTKSQTRKFSLVFPTR